MWIFVCIPGTPALDLSNVSYSSSRETKLQICLKEVVHSALINILFTLILVKTPISACWTPKIPCLDYRKNHIKLWGCPSWASWIFSLIVKVWCKGRCFALSILVSSGTEFHLSLCCRLCWAPRMPSGSCRWRECNSASQSWCCICQTRFDDYWIYGHILT